MAILIEPYRKEHEPAVADFNRRLQSGGAERDLVFYERAVPRWPSPNTSSIFNEYFVALDGSAVRGGYALKRQDFWFSDGAVRSIGYYHHPLSEGIVNKSYAIVGTLLLRDALQRSPLLYCLGMGGYDRPLPKMLVGLGWSHCLLPFYFRVVHPRHFLSEMQSLRTSRWRRLAMDLAANTGAGWIANQAHRIATGINAPRVAPYSVAEIDEFSDWVDSLWEGAKGLHTLTAVRNSQALRTLYPASDKHFTRLRISRKGTDIGWAVVAERRKDEKYGSLRVGSVVDCWASAENALPVVRAAAAVLEERGMDLIVSNQSHHTWREAFGQAGFLQAQSNFIFATSKRLGELLKPFGEVRDHLHFTRADGDGLPRNF